MGHYVKDKLWGGKGCDIPENIAVCPECGGKLYAWCVEWETETGQPTNCGIQVDCDNEKWFEDGEDTGQEHRYWQSDWQPTIDKVNKWAMVSAE